MQRKHLLNMQRTHKAKRGRVTATPRRHTPEKEKEAMPKMQDIGQLSGNDFDDYLQELFTV